MNNYYENYSKFLVSADCVIFGFSENQLKVLIQKRPYEPCKGEYSLIGGFIQEEENDRQAAERLLKEFTGLTHVYIQQLGAFAGVNRDPGGRVISIVYYALIKVDEYDEHLSDKHNAQWVDIDKLPLLCFDHTEMVERAHKKLREQMQIEPIGFNLLPKYFTLTKLQKLHESIIGATIDKRNFRRSILEKDCIVKTGLVDKLGSKRGASLYMYKQTTNTQTN